MMSHHTAHGMFAHSDIDDIRIAFGNSDSTDGTSFKITIGDISPTDPHVVGFPETATSRPHVIGFGIAHHSGPRNRTPATKRADRSPFNCFKNSVVIISSSALRSLGEYLSHKEAQKTQRQ